MRRRLLFPTIVLASLALSLPLAAQDEDKGTFGKIGDAFSNFYDGLKAGRKLQNVEKIEPTSDQPHDLALHEGYLELSRVEYAEGDYRDSDVFAERAEAAAAGKLVEPENISARDLPVRVLNEGAIQRRRLVVVQFRGSRDKIPDQSAEAQVAFDCWMQEQEEDFQFDDIAACVDRFDAAMGKVQLALGPAPTSPTPGAKLGRLITEVFFEFDSAEITEAAKQNIVAFSKWVKVYNKPVVSILGNADQSGAVDYNVKLAERRAQAVVKELEAEGVTPSGVFSRGDQVPVIDRPDRAPERINRRVILIVREE